MLGVFVSVGALAGSISDRISREATVTIGTAIWLLGMILLMLISDTSQPSMLYMYSIFYGLGSGIIKPALAAAATDIFQGRGAGAIIGFVWFAFAIGGTIGPWLGGAIFETSGRYLPAFVISAVVLALGCISLWVAAPRRVSASMATLALNAGLCFLRFCFNVLLLLLFSYFRSRTQP